MNKFKVIFCGTPDFAIPTLEILKNHSYIDLIYIISMPDKNRDRGQNLLSPEVIQYAKKYKINFFQTQDINKENDFLEKIEGKKIDFIFVLAFAQFLGKRILSLPRQGCFNIHTSILPKYRGASPIQFALLNGDQKTGVSIQRMVSKMDAGNIVFKKEILIHEDETGGLLYTRLKFQAALSLNEFIIHLLKDNIKEEVQNENLVSFASILKKEDGHLNFKSSTSFSIKNKVRALHPWPGTFIFLNNKRLKIIEVEAYPNLNLKAGEINIHFGKILIGTKDTPLHLKYLQLEGKKPCTDTELLNGVFRNLKDETPTIT